MAKGTDAESGFVAVCTILGGPNGAGKSTIFSLLNPPGEYVSADLFARQFDPADQKLHNVVPIVARG